MTHNPTELTGLLKEWAEALFFLSIVIGAATVAVICALILAVFIRALINFFRGKDLWGDEKEKRGSSGYPYY